MKRVAVALALAVLAGLVVSSVLAHADSPLEAAAPMVIGLVDCATFPSLSRPTTRPRDGPSTMCRRFSLIWCSMVSRSAR
jgi:hypothetical protein